MKKREKLLLLMISAVLLLSACASGTQSGTPSLFPLEKADEVKAGSMRLARIEGHVTLSDEKEDSLTIQRISASTLRMSPYDIILIDEDLYCPCN